MDPISQIWHGEYSREKLAYKKLRNEVIEKWTVNELAKTKDNVERIRIVRRHSEENIKLIKEIIDNNVYWKNGSLAADLRLKGNEYYKNKNLKGALRGYNLSLCFSPPKEGEELMLAYANRSACFLELNRIQNCLKDIQLSWEIADFGNDEQVLESQNLKKKLIERKKKCKEKLQSDSSPDKSQSLSVPPEFILKTVNDVIPSAEQFVTIEDHPERGRHVRVTENIKPGTLLIAEHPLAKVLIKHLLFNLDRCDNCQTKLFDCGIPCNGCVFVMYCDEKCYAASEPIHGYECQISSRLHNMGLSRITLLALRVVTKVGPSELYSFWKDNVMKKVPNEEEESEDASKSSEKRGILGFNVEGVYSSLDYLTIYNLIYHDSVLSEKELCQYSLESILIIDLLEKYTEYFAVPKYTCQLERGMFVDFVASLLLLHQMNFPCNAHSLNELELVNYGQPTREEIRGGVTREYGACAFPLLSLINHSCDPNVTRVTLPNGQNAVVAIRRIKAGEEVLDNYGPHYAIEHLNGRQKHLKNNYSFQCACVACRFTWPTVAQMKKLDKNTFTCMDCREDLSLQSDYKEILNSVLDSKGNCGRCKKSYDLTLLEKELEVYGAKFNDAYELVLENKGRESLPKLHECLLYFESQMLPPYIYTNYSQETLKQAFNLINM